MELPESGVRLTYEEGSNKGFRHLPPKSHVGHMACLAYTVMLVPTASGSVRFRAWKHAAGCGEPLLAQALRL